jgi:hypothetical protein
VSGPFDDERPRWPDRDLDRGPARDAAPDPDPVSPPPEVEASEPTTSLGDPPDAGWSVRRDGDRRRPTTAEQAVPWLIGLVLALSGIVVVLMALIFIGPEGVAGVPTPTPSASAPEPTPTPTPAASPTPVPTVGPTASPPPVFGALDMTYLARATSSAPIRLLRHDFSTTTDPLVLLDAGGVARYAWAADGRLGVALVGGKAMALVEGQEPRQLTDPIDAVIFGEDSTTLYGLRVARDGDNDRAEVLTIDFATGATEILTTITYPHLPVFAESALKEAHFADEGGLERLYVTVSGYVVAWILGAPATYQIDPESGAYTQLDQRPVLWSPDQRTRIDLVVSGSATTMTLLDQDGVAQASVKVTGLVSHVRWAATDNEIVFTLGRTIGGGVHQDLYIWDLVDGKAPAALTSNGASFGAEWLGVLQAWRS